MEYLSMTLTTRASALMASERANLSRRRHKLLCHKLLCHFAIGWGLPSVTRRGAFISR
jgi:hypothetical protein